jgi:hypothetical protein
MPVALYPHPQLPPSLHPLPDRETTIPVMSCIPLLAAINGFPPITTLLQSTPPS